MIGVEPTRTGFAEPTFPIDTRLGKFRVDGVVPLALGAVAAVGRLAEHERPDHAVANQLRRLVPFFLEAKHRADLHHALGALAGVVNVKPFAEVAGHRLLDQYVLARLHRLDGHRRVPVIHRGNHDCIDVLALEKFSVVVVDIARLDTHEFLRAVAVLGEHVARRRRSHVVLGFVVLDLANVRVEPLATHADEANVDAIVGPDHPAG